MALLLNREVVGITCSIKIQVMPALSHGHRLTCSYTTTIEISYVSRFSEQIADAIVLPSKVIPAPPLRLAEFRPLFAAATPAYAALLRKEGSSVSRRLADT